MFLVYAGAITTLPSNANKCKVFNIMISFSGTPVYAKMTASFSHIFGSTSVEKAAGVERYG